MGSLWEWYLGQCKSNCGFALLNFAIWYRNTFLNKCGYVHIILRCIPLFMSFANELMLDKKQICVIFLFEFKMGHKAAETTSSVNNAPGPGTANECVLRQGSTSFAKETRALMRSVVAGHQKLTMTNWEILLQLQEELPKNSTSTILWLFGTGSKLERWKSLISGCLMSWPKIKKSFWSAVFSYSTQEQWNISPSDFGMWQEVDFTQQPVTTSSVVARRSSQALPKAKLSPKKCHGHCLMVWGQIHPPQLSESQLNHYIWEVCSANGWDAPKTAIPAASTGQQKGPSSLWQLLTSRHTTNASKAE